MKKSQTIYILEFTKEASHAHPFLIYVKKKINTGDCKSPYNHLYLDGKIGLAYKF